MTEAQKKLPVKCPACESALAVKRLVCLNCNTAVEGSFGLPFLSGFSKEEQDFILEFVRSSGSIKKMADHMKKSYPSVRNYLDDIIEKLNSIETPDK